MAHYSLCVQRQLLFSSFQQTCTKSWSHCTAASFVSPLSSFYVVLMTSSAFLVLKFPCRAMHDETRAGLCYDVTAFLKLIKGNTYSRARTSKASWGVFSTQQHTALHISVCVAMLKGRATKGEMCFFSRWRTRCYSRGRFDVAVRVLSSQ